MKLARFYIFFSEQKDIWKNVNQKPDREYFALLLKNFFYLSLLTRFLSLLSFRVNSNLSDVNPFNDERPDCVWLFTIKMLFIFLSLAQSQNNEIEMNIFLERAFLAPIVIGRQLQKNECFSVKKTIEDK